MNNKVDRIFNDVNSYLYFTGGSWGPTGKRGGTRSWGPGGWHVGASKSWSNSNHIDWPLGKTIKWGQKDKRIGDSGLELDYSKTWRPNSKNNEDSNWEISTSKIWGKISKDNGDSSLEPSMRKIWGKIGKDNGDSSWESSMSSTDGKRNGDDKWRGPRWQLGTSNAMGKRRQLLQNVMMKYRSTNLDSIDMNLPTMRLILGE